MLGVFADAGLKNVGKLDYVDRFTEADAGSPVRDNKNYPLKELYLVDNVCREALGFEATGYEPQLCPREEQVPGATAKPGHDPDSVQSARYLLHPAPLLCGFLLRLEPTDVYLYGNHLLAFQETKKRGDYPSAFLFPCFQFFRLQWLKFRDMFQFCG